ncbi:hypothetical protein B0H12DRAFT_1068334 [Mycena haematopus]|nr:hypothetical protein B0H12DRAFT_1068334 [Mycena haematopus]
MKTHWTNNHMHSQSTGTHGSQGYPRARGTLSRPARGRARVLVRARRYGHLQECQCRASSSQSGLTCSNATPSVQHNDVVVKMMRVSTVHREDAPESEGPHEHRDTGPTLTRGHKGDGEYNQSVPAL